MEEDYNELSEGRRVLLQRLATILGNVQPHFWAACQVADMENLALMVQMAELNRDVVWLAALNTSSMVAHWDQRQPMETHGPQLPSPGSTSPSPSLIRSMGARYQALLRDNHKCVITGQGNVAAQVCHIYPFELLPADEEPFGKRAEFWARLGMFCSPVKIAAWEAAIFPHGRNGDGVETVENLITLSADAHVLWNLGAFALKPISVSEDRKTLRVQFFWQVKQSLDMPQISLTTAPCSTRDLDHSGGACLVKFSDPPPRARPLPSIAVLEIQWFLQRITGMAGLVEVEDMEGSYFSDDGMANDALDEVAGESKEVMREVIREGPILIP